MATTDIVKEVTANNTSVVIHMYVDDTVLGSSKREDLQMAFNRLVDWAEDNQFTINRDKTIQMVFRKGGRITKTNSILFGQKKLSVVNHFNYLEIRLQTMRTSFETHIKEKAIAANRAS